MAQGGALGSVLLVGGDTGRCSSAVERVLGKDEVTGSSPVIGSRYLSELFQCERNRDQGKL